jgi:hypothetical protein
VIHEESAIRQSRQGIVKGVMEQSVFGALAISDVLNLKD